MTYTGKRAECEQYENWFNEKCQNIHNHIGAKMNDNVWFCSNCQKFNKLDSEPEFGGQLFKGCVENITCTVRGETDNLIRKINTLHGNLEFTMERTDKNGNLAFCDININVYSCNQINCE